MWQRLLLLAMDLVAVLGPDSCGFTVLLPLAEKEMI
jgi:hypothetical protein